MTTVAQVRKLVRPLLSHHPDLTLVGRTVIIKPVCHLLRAIIISRTSAAEQFAPCYAATLLFDASEFFNIGWGGSIWRAERWAVNDPSTQAALIAAVEQSALPRLRRVESIDDFIAYTDNPHFVGRVDLFPDKGAIIHAARGNIDTALAACDEVKRQGHIKQLRPEVHARVIDHLEPLLQAGDRAGVARLLHEWEAISVRNLRLEKYWQPSPFPIEQ